VPPGGLLPDAQDRLDQTVAQPVSRPAACAQLRAPGRARQHPRLHVRALPPAELERIQRVGRARAPAPQTNQGGRSSTRSPQRPSKRGTDAGTGIETVYRYFTEQAARRAGAPTRWAAALAAAAITDECPASAVAAKLPKRIEAAAEPQLADTVAGRLAMFTEVELQGLGLTPNRREDARPPGMREAPARTGGPARARPARVA